MSATQFDIGYIGQQPLGNVSSLLDALSRRRVEDAVEIADFCISYGDRLQDQGQIEFASAYREIARDLIARIQALDPSLVLSKT